MADRFKGFKRWIFAGAVLFLALVLSAAFYWRYDILRTTLDPKIPFQTYDPPPAPNYAKPEAWALLPQRDAAGKGSADVFFVHPTSYDGGRDWNAPFDQPKAARDLARVMLPNYAAPFARVGRIFAPHYRQASLYTFLTLRDDARDARRFAYDDVREAFRHYLRHDNGGRPIVLVGVEQGGILAARLLNEEIAPRTRRCEGRLVGVYLIETVVPADEFGPARPCRPACAQRGRLRGRLGLADGRRLPAGPGADQPIAGLERGGRAGHDGRPPAAVRQPAAGGPQRDPRPGQAEPRRGQRHGPGVGLAAGPAQAPGLGPVRERPAAHRPAEIDLAARQRLVDRPPQGRRLQPVLGRYRGRRAGAGGGAEGAARSGFRSGGQ
jgi:hypothetical protein